MSTSEAAQTTLPVIEGVHHAAYIAQRLDATHRLWTDTLGLRFTWAIINRYVPSTGTYSPHIHVFYALADQSHVAYFGIDRQTLDPGPQWTDHPARVYGLVAARPDDLALWQARLAAAGVATHYEPTACGFDALAFRDPEGLRWQVLPAAPTYTEADRVRAAQIVVEWLACDLAPAAPGSAQEGH
jgi:catechol 2,3-dioxygenase-like lactoylglutathione lyase family enzyme